MWLQAPSALRCVARYNSFHLFYNSFHLFDVGCRSVSMRSRIQTIFLLINHDDTLRKYEGCERALNGEIQNPVEAVNKVAWVLKLKPFHQQRLVKEQPRRVFYHWIVNVN